MAKKKSPPKGRKKPTAAAKATPKPPAKPKPKKAEGKTAAKSGGRKAPTASGSSKSATARKRVRSRAAGLAPAPAGPAAGPAVGIQVGGGTLIRGGGGKGTVTVACMDVTSTPNVLSLLTASHVVGRLGGVGKAVRTLDGQDIGTVTRVGGLLGVPLDAAVIDITGQTARHEVEAGGKVITIRKIDQPVPVGKVVIHGGPHGNGGTVKGTVVAVDAGALTLVFNELSQESKFQIPAGLMKIAPVSPAAAFGKSGDSGAPVMTEASGGKHNVVGLLVAVDPNGFGYAHHMADLPGGTPGVLSLAGVEDL